jgi:hypothetical protein
MGRRGVANDIPNITPWPGTPEERPAAIVRTCRLSHVHRTTPNFERAFSLITPPMSDSAGQSFSNHTRFHPLYHFIGTPLLVVLLVWNIRQLVATPTVASLMGVLTILALGIVFALVRLYPLKAQDRIIRLEEQLRLARVLPSELQPSIARLNEHQLVALRFASDAELADLVRQVIDQKITSRKAIKQQIRQWRPDTFRV